jgi:hypothetical protein
VERNDGHAASRVVSLGLRIVETQFRPDVARNGARIDSHARPATNADAYVAGHGLDLHLSTFALTLTVNSA